MTEEDTPTDEELRTVRAEALRAALSGDVDEALGLAVVHNMVAEDAVRDGGGER